MGYCSDVTCGIGLRVRVSDLIAQITPENFERLSRFLDDYEFIEGNNHDTTNIYMNAREDGFMAYERSKNVEDFKSFFRGPIGDAFLLKIIVRHVNSDIWGTGDGTTIGGSVRMDNFHDQARVVESEYSWISGASVVYVLRHHGG